MPNGRCRFEDIAYDENQSGLLAMAGSIDGFIPSRLRYAEWR
jgi:hypothetical protein